MYYDYGGEALAMDKWLLEPLLRLPLQHVKTQTLPNADDNRGSPVSREAAGLNIVERGPSSNTSTSVSFE
ncbi:uncharacterized protein PHALS_13033 [Plasmopara halstedii]|uniref:Uncharacterized protein n=1 Tax=Plasmopara halstedii TaxID=4781 RepID=A0A0P1ANW8_PLAHL|nr:uncharacterized protein PHALS_13033 [Plasmopara halstedii]CEG42784.1 hypothetical protein PHALS_13033 [Plasmopara halstedii]|eukprot:XP_024579153.1 hypothetical protein PHALS_13033 [Plasmopara halstedii]